MWCWVPLLTAMPHAGAPAAAEANGGKDLTLGTALASGGLHPVSVCDSTW